MEESESKVCPNCKREIPAVNFTIHTVHCARNIKVCPVCKEPVPQHELQEHHDKLHKLMPCKQCGESVCGTDLEDHIRDSCGHTIKSCRYCELELPRHELPAHEGYCGVRTEQCADCKEWVMIKYRQLHLDSNHGFLRLDDDPVPQTKKAPPKTSANPIRDMLASTSNGLRNVPHNGLRPAAGAPRESPRLPGNPGRSVAKNTEAPRTSALASNGIGGGSSGMAGGSAGIGGSSGIRNGTANGGRNFDLQTRTFAELEHGTLNQGNPYAINKNKQQQNLTYGASKIQKFLAKQRNLKVTVARSDHGDFTAVNNDDALTDSNRTTKPAGSIIDNEANTNSGCAEIRNEDIDHSSGATEVDLINLFIKPNLEMTKLDRNRNSTSHNIKEKIRKFYLKKNNSNSVPRDDHAPKTNLKSNAALEIDLIDFNDLTSEKCKSKPNFEATGVDQGPSSNLNITLTIGVSTMENETLKTVKRYPNLEPSLTKSRHEATLRDFDDLTTGASKMGYEHFKTMNRFSNIGGAAVNHLPLNNPRRKENPIDINAFNSAKCESKREVITVDIGALKAVNPSLARKDNERLKTVNLANLEAVLNTSTRTAKVTDLDVFSSTKFESKRKVTTVDIGALKAVNTNFGAARIDQVPSNTLKINLTIEASIMESEAQPMNSYSNLGVATVNHSAINDPRREENLIDFDELTAAECNETTDYIGGLKSMNPSFEVIKVDYAPSRTVNDLISENIQQFSRSEGVPTTSSSGVRHTPNVNGVAGGSGEGRRTLAKRSNDQPQINTAVSSVNKVHKDMATSRGAIKKRPAPKPPADRKRDLQYYGALQRQQAEERQRQELSAYNASVGLPPVLSPAAKLDKLRKMDALHNREVEDTDYKNRLQGRVWMNSADASTSAGHRLGSNSPEDPNVRNELRNLKPMTPAEFMARFEQLQLQDDRPAKGDRFSEIKTSLRELRRGLNEVTAPYNSNSTNSHNDRSRHRSASSSPVEELEADLDVGLPCEFCGALVPAHDLVQHQTGCRPDLTQLRPRAPPVPAPSPPLPPDPYENPVIPCEFCTESLPVYLISEHQERCRRDPNLLFPD